MVTGNLGVEWPSLVLGLGSVLGGVPGHGVGLPIHLVGFGVGRCVGLDLVFVHGLWLFFGGVPGHGVSLCMDPGHRLVLGRVLGELWKNF